MEKEKIILALILIISIWLCKMRIEKGDNTTAILILQLISLICLFL